MTASNLSATPSAKASLNRKSSSLSWDQFELQSEAVEQCALQTEGIDSFCSSVDWAAAAHVAWAPELKPYLAKLPSGFVAFLRDGAVLTPFDRAWGYSCPVIGPPAVAAELAALLRAQPEVWQVIAITGLRQDAPLFTAVIEAFAPWCDLALGHPQQRWLANLVGYFGRRSAKFLREIRRIERNADKAGITIEPVADSSGDPAREFERVLSVEKRSWKGPDKTGLNESEMRAFYAELFKRLRERDRFRLRFARIDGEDIGYIAGGVIGDQYRGLQFSFDDRFRSFAPGNLMQIAEIRSLMREGFRGYDMGIHIPYKARWADDLVETTTLIIRRPAVRAEPLATV